MITQFGEILHNNTKKLRHTENTLIQFQSDKNSSQCRTMANIQIVYGSNGGNTTIVCHYVKETLESMGHNVNNDRCEHFPEDNLVGKHDILMLACPTYEHGELEPSFLKNFWPRIQGLDLKQQKCIVIGLGDIKYDIEYHMESARILQKYVEDHNGEVYFQNLMVSGKPIPALETIVKKWCERLHQKLST